MEKKTEKFLEDMVEFCRQSMVWCYAESEKSTDMVSDILGILLEDTKRVSSISKDTLKAVDKMRELIDSLKGPPDREAANELAKVLNQMAGENDEISSFSSPIIESLQFQDRITQNIENLSKIMNYWLENRSQYEASEMTEDQRLKVGNDLMAMTTMAEERDLIREVIPGLPNNDQTDGEPIFF